ncbi:MAG: hypothetical protein KAV82_12570, partial [Phycisphaerae bacterium]|nr:hypothetical protein [Phycisphaerae bacterium]
LVASLPRCLLPLASCLLPAARCLLPRRLFFGRGRQRPVGERVGSYELFGLLARDGFRTGC